MSYATPANLLARVDARIVNDLIGDDNIAISPIDLLTHATVQAALDDASGDIDAALLTAQRYSTADLTGLTGNAQKHLIRMCSDIAFAYLLMRRPSVSPDMADAYRKLSQEHLDKLAKGYNVFDLTSQQTASLPTIDGPSTVDYSRLNGIPERASGYYPDRKQRIPTDRN